MSNEIPHEKQKPHVNIGTIGHVDHSKHTLLAAIKMVLANTEKENGSKNKDLPDQGDSK